jgi:hypothetical protein
MAARSTSSGPAAPAWVHPVRHHAGTARVLFGLLGAPLAWTVHLSASYFILAVACPAEWRHTGAALAGLTLLCLAVAAAAGLAAYRLWRRVGNARGDWGEALTEPGGRSALLMMVGMALAPVFALIILLGGLIPVLVPVCAAAMFR